MAAAEIGGADIYSLASALGGVVSVAAMPLWGYFAARRPDVKRVLFCASMLVGVVAVAVRAFAPDMVVMIATGILWGFVSAGVYVVGYSMIRDIYEPQKAGVYFGFLGTMMAIGGLAGPLVAGVVMDSLGWRAVCHIIWPILLLGTLMVLFGVKVTKEEVADLAVKGGKFDASGTIAVVVLLATLISGLSLGANFLPFGSLASNAVFVVAAASLVWLVVVIRRKQADAIIPAPALKDRNVVCFAVANTFINFSNMAIFFFMPMYVLYVMQGSALEASLVTTMFNVAPLFMAPIFGKMVGKRMNARLPLAIATVLRIAVPVALLAYCSPGANIVVIYVILFVAGVYNAAQSTCFSAGPQIQVPAKLRVQGNSVIQVGQNLGSSIGMAVYTVLIGAMGVVGGFTVALAVSAVAAGIALVFVLMLKKLEEE